MHGAIPHLGDFCLWLWSQRTQFSSATEGRAQLGLQLCRARHRMCTIGCVLSQAATRQARRHADLALGQDAGVFGVYRLPFLCL